MFEISKNTFFTEHLASVTSSDLGNVSQIISGLSEVHQLFSRTL